MPQKGYLVRYKAQIISGCKQIKDSTSIHIADIERMTIATTLMTNKSTNASKNSAGSRDNTKNNRERDTIATGDLDPQPLKLQRGSGKVKKGDKRINNSKQKKEMFVSQEKTNARSRCNKIRAETRAQGQDDESSSLYSEEDERKVNMNEGAPAVESSRNEELSLQSLNRGSRKNSVISCGDTQNTHQAQHDITCSDKRSANDDRLTRN
jgi:hypothetical protein